MTSGTNEGAAAGADPVVDAGRLAARAFVQRHGAALVAGLDLRPHEHIIFLQGVAAGFYGAYAVILSLVETEGT